MTISVARLEFAEGAVDSPSDLGDSPGYAEKVLRYAWQESFFK